MKNVLFVTVLMFTGLIAPGQSNAQDLRPSEAEWRALVRSFPSIANVVIEHMGTVAQFGEENKAGNVVSFRFEGNPLGTMEESAPFWTLDEWVPTHGGGYLVTHWRFTIRDAKQGIFLRRGGALEIIRMTDPVPITEEVAEKARIAWQILCRNISCDSAR